MRTHEVITLRVYVQIVPTLQLVLPMFAFYVVPLAFVSVFLPSDANMRSGLEVPDPYTISAETDLAQGPDFPSVTFEF